MSFVILSCLVSAPECERRRAEAELGLESPEIGAQVLAQLLALR